MIPDETTKPTTDEPVSDEARPGLAGAQLGELVARHRDFLAFVERRVGDRAVAEDLLGDAFLRAADPSTTLRDGESTVAWFYRVLRNAIIDRHRRGGARDRGLARYASEVELAPEVPADERNAICECIAGLATTLKPEYAEALARVELDGASVGEFAAEAGITVNNASVRLHRARNALRARLVDCCGTCATHGCFDCTCSSAPRPR